MITCVGYATSDAKAPLKPFKFDRRNVGETDVSIEILFCGVCHSDLHIARNEWSDTIYPCVPGHEIVGRVVEIGTSVGTFVVGDLVGVGCIVDSCRTCESCTEGLEQYCETGLISTYNSPERGTHTFGGYSTHIVVEQDFVLKIPGNLDPAAAAPLLCAGITTYSPLRNWKVGPGSKVAIVGLGGLGHMAVKIANAMGADVTMITTSPSKVEDARRLGAHNVLISTDADAMARHASKFDIVLDAVSADHSIDTYASLVRRDGTVILIGAPEKPVPVAAFTLIARRRSFAGSMIGGIAETQEMLDFCGKHGIVSDIEIIEMSEINRAYERMLASDVKYRFVIDLKSMAEATTPD